jgi:D-alanyl-D-alanine dipeptidase
VSPFTLAAALAVAALAALRRRRPGGGALAAGTAAVSAAYQALRPLDLAPDAAAKLAAIAASAGAEGISVTATSGRRDSVRQASAMLAKVDRGEDLRALYRDKGQIEELLRGPQTVDAWAATIRRYADAGRPLSSHLSGRAVDLRIRDLTPAQLDRLRALALAGGARRAIVEPDHLHVEL